MDLRRIPGGPVAAPIVSLAAAISSLVVNAVASGFEMAAQLVHPCAPRATEATTDTRPGARPEPEPLVQPIILPPDKWFHFRGGWDRDTGAVARNLDEFAAELKVGDPDVISHHSWRGDFSRWVADVVGDRELAQALGTVEADVRTGVTDSNAGRDRLLEALHLAA